MKAGGFQNVMTTLVVAAGLLAALTATTLLHAGGLVAEMILVSSE